MKNRNRRLSVVVDLIRNNYIGSQEHLCALLKENGFPVTQATLSRDLKTLRISKSTDKSGRPIYLVPDGPEIKEHISRIVKISPSHPTVSIGFLSLSISNNMAVIKTRNGYAPAMAYDIDMSMQPEILGTIPGSDTIFVVLQEGLTHAQIYEVFDRLFPLAKVDEKSAKVDEKTAKVDENLTRVDEKSKKNAKDADK
jgi:transcriptional regulator of arginine metabolism